MRWIALLLFIPASSFALDSYRILSGGSAYINEFSECLVVTNNHADGKDIFVPSKTLAEWNSFKANPPAGVTAAACSGYSPLTEGNMRLWLDASDSSTLFQLSTCATPAVANADPIGCWRDKSGLNQHVIQATAGARPTLSTNAMNSQQNVILFNNTSRPLAGSFAAAATGLVIYVVGNYNNASGADRAFLEISTGTGNRHFYIYQRYSSNTNFTPTPNVDSVFVISHPSGTAFAAYQDSTTLQNGTSEFGAANGTYGNIVLGDDSSSGNQLRGEISEILVFQGTHTVANRQRVEGYLACKWGTQPRLPAAHPYKSTCP